ncbi:hypothetical protein SETIT_7G126200v2 [Setaria italica]|uniref:Uncharacterized protein n=1 Tax=Setaria italica TaxID=4555 RepID=A0A368RV13_SETIT|nr:hypothetical protein SETIT_7G126200v2 [Setaria italica]
MDWSPFGSCVAIAGGKEAACRLVWCLFAAVVNLPRSSPPTCRGRRRVRGGGREHAVLIAHGCWCCSGANRSQRRRATRIAGEERRGEMMGGRNIGSFLL